MRKTSFVSGNRDRLFWFLAFCSVLALLLAVGFTPRKYPSKSPSIHNHDLCNTSQKSGELEGLVEGGCCDYKSVNRMNTEVLNPLLEELVKTPFFRYFKVKLRHDCPAWHQKVICKKADCAVSECPEDEFPEQFKQNMTSDLSSNGLECQGENPQAAVDRSIDAKFNEWMEEDNLWTYDDESDSDGMTYVNLQANPERFTGYSGASARRIWNTIHPENSHEYTSEESCPEKRTLHKLMSGIHSSVSTHIAAAYPFDEEREVWGKNLTLLDERVLRHPKRVRHLYFTLLFVLRAVTKAADYLDQGEYDTGNPEEDLKAKSIVHLLVHNAKLQDACPLPFDEATLWKGESGPELLEQIQAQFRNISSLMDCVGCETCRLWGKLQLLGLGTALKILFSGIQENASNMLQLQKNEVIALMNLLKQLSESVKIVTETSKSLDLAPGGLFL